MNKAQLVDRMADAAGVSRSAADKALAGLLEAVSETLESGERVTLVGFGTFSVTERKARSGRNPRTGESIEIPARKIVKFKAGSRLAEGVE